VSAKKILTPAHDDLARLTEALERAEQRLADTQRAATKRFAPLPEMKRREGDAYAADDGEYAKLREERLALEAEAGDWQVRVTGCQAAVDAATRARRAFVQDHGDRLVAEAAPEARASRDRLAAVLHEFQDVHRGYAQVEGRLRAFVDYRRHQPDDPALAALAMAVDRVLAAGNQDPMPLPAPVVEEVA
jgi:hypothetical protein